ncbi:MAG: hypothetical protein MHMPM18_000021 [Marteilia pararefringens]
MSSFLLHMKIHRLVFCICGNFGDILSYEPGEVDILELMIMTAKTVAKEGAQFEILIKTKQNNNNKFAFLLDDNMWNVFYCILRNHFSHRFLDSITIINTVKSFKHSREPKSTIDEQVCIDLNHLDTSLSTFADLARQMKEVNDSHIAVNRIESNNELESKKSDFNMRDDIFQSIVAKYVSVYGEELKDKLKCEPNYKFLLDEDSNYHRYYRNFNTSDN